MQFQAIKDAEKAAQKAQKQLEVAAREDAQQGGPDPLAHRYGELPLIQSTAWEPYTAVQLLAQPMPFFWHLARPRLPLHHPPGPYTTPPPSTQLIPPNSSHPNYPAQSNSV